MLYSYYCKVCEKPHEVQKPIKNMHDPERCPDCRELMERQISAPSFQLKGSGFFKNDYPKGSK